MATTQNFEPEHLQQAAKLWAKLTDRQRNVCTMCANSVSSKEIAVRIGVSEKTVDTHRYAGYRVLGVNSIQALAMVYTLASMHHSLQRNSAQFQNHYFD